MSTDSEICTNIYIISPKEYLINYELVLDLLAIRYFNVSLTKSFFKYHAPIFKYTKNLAKK